MAQQDGSSQPQEAQQGIDATHGEKLEVGPGPANRESDLPVAPTGSLSVPADGPVAASLKLMIEEEAVVEFEDEEKAEQIALSMIGRLNTTNSFNIEAMKSTLKNVWKPIRGIIIKQLDQNLFIFQVLLEKCLTNSMGKFVCVDDENLMGIDKSLNFIADIDITKPLPRGIKVKVCRKPIWFNIKYVRLLDLCYAYGMLDHIYRGWKLYDDNVPEPFLPYGPQLRASTIKSRRKAKKVKTKLIFDNPLAADVTPNLNKDEHDSIMMNIDEAKIIIPGIEMFKRKSLKAATFDGYTGIVIACRGRSGGSALSWKVKLRVSLLSMAMNHIDVISSKWRFTGIYGFPKTQNKLKTCDLIFDLCHHHFSLPWLVVTQWNGQEEDSSVAEILDRFYATSEWSAHFSMAKVHHIDDGISDHLSILLNCFDTHQSRTRGRRKRFENMWALDQKWEDIIRLAWSQFVEEDVVGMIQKERNLFAQIREWRRLEEVMWWQQSRVSYMQHGDRNIGWFHQRANGRHALNFITKLKGANGAMYSSQEDLERVVAYYFATLFTSSKPSQLNELLDYVTPKLISLEPPLCVILGLMIRLCGITPRMVNFLLNLLIM
ncbi:LOW QUALITY PROTEIN: hypothetical protein Cgig2_029646 [Carnegiea gigantea]|uniref:DUF4283 domain-containing protein n=1 Tax=Carnegiea gigantea TaxID=171969 RepID=A0A9Q1KGA6_9CARY|nr:LOW QUALITY PROTEIN: hypothetical protein Cgig2_029646 [Carnegiea gigantea]